MAGISGDWWRQLPHGGDPLWLADPAPDGRWQRGEQVAALYLAADPATAWAEWHRALAEYGLPPTHGMPRDLWRYELSLEQVVDLSLPERLREHGLATPRPTRREWPAFQDVGERLRQEGHRGVLYRSAARPGELALCLFREGADLPGVTPIRPPQTYRTPPPPPEGLRT